MRHDIHGKDGLVPARQSASTMVSSTSSSSSVGAIGQRPTSGMGVGANGANSANIDFGQEQDVR